MTEGAGPGRMPMRATTVMKYQLVLQFPSDAFETERAVEAFEQDLIKVLGEDGYVDGIDLGRNEIRFFVFSADPSATFQRVTPLLERRDLLDAVTVAQRQSDSEEYTVLWPEGCRTEFRMQ